MPALGPLMAVGWLCLTFVGCSPSLKPVDPINEPSLHTRIAAIPPVDQPPVEGLPGTGWGLPIDLVGEDGKPPFGWLFWVLAWPIFWLTMALLRYFAARRKKQEGDKD